MIRRKKILICDDQERNFIDFKELLEDRYEIHWCSDYRYVINDLQALGVVPLLILDLGFPLKEGSKDSADDKGKKYVAQECIPEVVKLFPKTKIIIHSDIFDKDKVDKNAKGVLNGIVGYSQVVAFLGSRDKAVKKNAEIDKAIGSPDWLLEGELWVLHVSDPQFGDDGLDYTPESLANQLSKTLKIFVTEQNDTENPREFPQIAVITGDLTQRARPSEFESAGIFVKTLSESLFRNSSSLAGVLADDEEKNNASNVIVIPGNHDINWDILRAMNLYIEDKKICYDDKKTYPDLNFIEEYAWAPFRNLKFGVPTDKSWIWDKGYSIINRGKEIGVIFVCLNSSRFKVNHLGQSPVVSSDILFKVGQELDDIDPNKECTRILLVHHPAIESIKNESDRLKLSDNETETFTLNDALATTCDFSLILSGHVHDFLLTKLECGSQKKTLHNICAGTTRSKDLKPFRRPQFNIIRLFDIAETSKRFNQFTIYNYEWIGDSFMMTNKFERRTKSSQTESILYF